MNAQEVREKVQAWVRSVIGITTMHAFQNVDAPPEPYASIHRVMSGKLRERPRGETFTEQGGVFSQIPLVDTYWRFSIDVFGPDAENHLQKLVAASDVPTAMWPLRPLVLAETSRIVTDFEIRDQNWHDRAQMTIEVHGVQQDGVPIDVIEQQKPVFDPVD